MKVFKIYSEEYYYAVCAESEEQAKAHLSEEYGIVVFDKIEEIPESEWDKKIIDIWEDNDLEKEPYKASIREEMCETYPQIIFTNDVSTFS